MGATDAVTEPDLISVVTNASSVNALLGMFLNLEPSAYIKEDESIYALPLKCEPLAIDNTLNPYSGATDAVTEPDDISVDVNASGVRAERGISNNPLPLPLNIDADILPNTSTLPVNSEPLKIDSTLNPN